MATGRPQLSGAGYINVAVQGSTDPNGAVVDQQPSGGTAADTGTKITLAVQSNSTSPTNGLAVCSATESGLRAPRTLSP